MVCVDMACYMEVSDNLLTTVIIHLDRNFTPSQLINIFSSLFISYSDKKLFHTHGPDALMYLIFLRNSFWFCIAVAGPAMVIILPINCTGSNHDLPSDDPYYVNQLGITTIGNISYVRPNLSEYKM